MVGTMARISARSPKSSGVVRTNIKPAVEERIRTFYYIENSKKEFEDKDIAYAVVASNIIATAPQSFRDRYTRKEIKEICDRLIRWLKWRDSRIPVWRVTGMLPRYIEMRERNAKWVRLNKLGDTR